MSKSKKKNTTKPASATATSGDALPEAQALSVVPAYDKKAKVWEATIREGKQEHVVLKATFDTDDAANSAGITWLGEYASADDSKRRKLLGWKQAKSTKANTAADAEQKPKSKKEPKKEGKGAKASARGPSGLDVAAQLFKAAKGSRRCKEVVDEMIAKKLWTTNGKTPGATIYAAIIREIAQKGKSARFKKTGRGEFEYNAASEGK